MKAIWKGQVLAESSNTVIVENNHYFPAESIHEEFFIQSDYQTTCPWKGLASYKTIQVDGETNQNAAWYYPDPKEAAKEIQDYFAFWKGVKIVE
jgi:uncharacterized protein (DUF427 family)